MWRACEGKELLHGADVGRAGKGDDDLEGLPVPVRAAARRGVSESGGNGRLRWGGGASDRPSESLPDTLARL